jgi:signal transduction histidine kinase
MRVFTLISGLLVALAGGLVLAIWGWSFWPGPTAGAGWMAMKPNAAAGLLFCGLALAMAARERAGFVARVVATVLAAGVCLLSGLTMLEYFSNLELGTAWVFVHDVVGTEPSQVRVTPSAAFCLWLAGVALLIALWPREDKKWLPVLKAFSLALMLIGSFAAAGSFADLREGYQFWNHTGLSALAAGGFVVLGAGLFVLARVQRGEPWALDRRTSIAFGAGIALMLVIVNVSYHFTEQLQRAATRVSDRQEGLRRIEALAAGFAELQSSCRAYVITGDESFLVDRRTEKAALRQDLEDLEERLAGDPEQRPRIVELELLTREALHRQGGLIAVRREEGFDAATMVFSTGGARLWSGIRDLLSSLREAESRALQAEQRRAERAAALAFLLLPLGIFLSLVMLLLAFFFLNVGARRRRKAEQSLRELNVELERRVAHRTAELEAANRELESFCYAVSHDLRAPLRGIAGFTRLLAESQSGAFDATGRDYLGRVLAATDRMNELIDDLLDLSRVSRESLRRERVDLSALAREIVADLREIAPERRAEFCIADGLVADADPRLLRILLENLLGNAWKFTSRKPLARIELARAREGEEDVFTVRDNGAGFDMRYAHKLFGPFQRLHARGEFPGTGIGLATVQRIVHRHGGRIWADGEEGAGAAFHFTL